MTRPTARTTRAARVLAGTRRYQAVSQGRNMDRRDAQVNDLVERHLRRLRTVGAPALGHVDLRRGTP